MFMALMLALVCTILGVVPLLLRKKGLAATVVGAIAMVVLSLVFYAGNPSMVWPMYGVVGLMVTILFVACGVADFITEDDPNNPSQGVVITILFVAVAACCWIVAGFSGWSAFRATSYANMIGDIEKREWTQDVQPKDPRHVRLVPKELAYYLATKQLGEAQGAIGSQFQISWDHLTLQMVKGELWYVGPLDYKGFASWTAAECSPGYVMVHGEDPKRPVIVKTGERFRYTPGAFFGDNLERHVWVKNPLRGFYDYTFELDDEGKAWWTITIFEPTISFWGEKILGTLLVDPVSGDEKFYSKDETPQWVDRVVPGHVAFSYADWYGQLRGGFWNSVWSHNNLMKPLTPSIVYGSDNNPYWVIDLSSVNEKDKSLVGLIYVNSRTGKATLYHAVGGTEDAVVELVNNRVSYRNLHGASPVLYNIYGVMTSIVPLLGESHSWQGVALVDVANMQVVDAEDEQSAFLKYQRMVVTSGQQLAPEKEHNLQKIEGTVGRFNQETKGSDTAYYLYVDGVQHIFVGTGDLSPKLKMTKPGDKVLLRFVESGEDTLMLSGFDNLSLPLAQSKLQSDLRARTKERQEEVERTAESKTVRGEVQNLSDKDLKELLELKKQKGKR